jgi:hypothetical protein
MPARRRRRSRPALGGEVHTGAEFLENMSPSPSKLGLDGAMTAPMRPKIHCSGQLEGARMQPFARIVTPGAWG